MNDLSHWDFSADFTGAQAVALVFGLDLNDIQAKQSMGVLGADASAKFAPACERMKQCYDAARGYCHDSLRPPRDWDEKRPAVMLHSVELSRRIQELDPEFDHYLCNWLGDDSYSGFETQRFARSEIVAWLACIGQVSIYAFDGAMATTPVPAQSNRTARWPWGDHHTELLGHLEAAARRYWMNYDPTDATTAPLSTVVSDWLCNDERKVSRTMADAIAQILRVDGLRTGPRSK